MKKVSSLLVMFLFVAASLSQAQDKKEYVYGGVKTCKACHMTKKSGAQYKVWLKTGHAKAFETLKSEKALAVGKKVGVPEPSTSPKCLKCHTTAYGVADNLKGKKLTMEEGVGCEACHGAGSAYKSRKIMKGIRAGELKAEDYGLKIPTEETCRGCHNPENPTHKEFNYKERLAKIAHPIPEK